FLRLIEGKRVQWQDRAHFFALSAKLMRRVLVDFARSRRAQKRGGEAYAIPLEEAAVVAPRRGGELIALDDALHKMTAIDSRKSQIIELRFFGGLSVDETAEVLKIAPSTIHSDLDKAKLWLLREIKGRI